MLVQESVEVALPPEEVEQALSRSDMSVWAAAAYRRGERMAVGPGIPGVAAAVELEVGEPLRGNETVSIPVAWRAAGARWLFPHMEAELVLTAVAPSTTRISLRGSYRPPLGGLGQVLDRLALYRVAEATVRNFLERLAAAVEEAAETSEREARRDSGAGAG